MKKINSGLSVLVMALFLLVCGMCASMASEYPTAEQMGWVEFAWSMVALVDVEQAAWGLIEWLSYIVMGASVIIKLLEKVANITPSSRDDIYISDIKYSLGVLAYWLDWLALTPKRNPDQDLKGPKRG